MVYAGTSYFGEFARNEIVTEVKKRHFNKALLISDAALDACGVVSKIKKVLDDADNRECSCRTFASKKKRC